MSYLMDSYDNNVGWSADTTLEDLADGKEHRIPLIETKRMKIMKIKYIFPTKTSAPDERCDITFESDSDVVPRIDELVNIFVQITKNEVLDKIGRVKDVRYYVKGKNNTIAVVCLSA